MNTAHSRIDSIEKKDRTVCVDYNRKRPYFLKKAFHYKGNLFDIFTNIRQAITISSFVPPGKCNATAVSSTVSIHIGCILYIYICHIPW